jgi:hypothetical protein
MKMVFPSIQLFYMGSMSPMCNRIEAVMKTRRRITATHHEDIIMMGIAPPFLFQSFLPMRFKVVTDH